MDISQDTGGHQTVAGLQAERTDLSWTRSSLAFLVNGSLLLGRHVLAEPSAVSLTAGAIALLLATFTAIMAYRRRRVLAKRPLPYYLAAPVSLLLVGVGTAGLGAVTLAVIIAG